MAYPDNLPKYQPNWAIAEILTGQEHMHARRHVRSVIVTDNRYDDAYYIVM